MDTIITQTVTKLGYIVIHCTIMFVMFIANNALIIIMIIMYSQHRQTYFVAMVNLGGLPHSKGMVQEPLPQVPIITIIIIIVFTYYYIIVF